MEKEKSEFKFPSKELSNKKSIPLLGLGTYKEVDESKLIKAVKAAIAGGYRHFDCAYAYGNEASIGKGIKEAIQESNGKLKRSDFFIVSKCWNTFHSAKKVKECIEESLKRLEMGYLDLYLMHWPLGFKEDAGDYPMENGKFIASDVHYLETYKAMEELVDEKLTHGIGVSNFNKEQLKDILDNCRIRPVCNQIEVNLTFPNRDLVEYCQKENVMVVAYAPLSSSDRPWKKPDDPKSPLEHPAILELAKAKKRTPAQIVLRWIAQRGIVVIPKSTSPERILENGQIFEFAFSPEEMKLFDQFKDEFRCYPLLQADNHQFYPFKN